MKPICVACQRFYRPTKTGIRFTEGMPKSVGTGAGKREPDQWQPYKLWMGDEWTCPDCNAVIIVGTGHDPVSVHHEPDFKQWHSQGFDKLQINDR